MAERVYYFVRRECNNGEGLFGAAALDVSIRVARDGCALAGSTGSGSFNGDTENETPDELESRAKWDAIKNIEGWCEDPCGLCRARVTMGSINVQLSDSPIELPEED